MRSPAAAGTATLRPRRPRWLDVVGVLGVIGLGFTVWLGLWVTPPDRFQGNLARLLYIHPAIATVALYWVGIVAAGGSLLYLWPRTRSLFWDRLAASAVEVGAVFAALTLVSCDPLPMKFVAVTLPDTTSLPLKLLLTSIRA